jgi:hypothetical protein
LAIKIYYEDPYGTEQAVYFFLLLVTILYLLFWVTTLG